MDWTLAIARNRDALLRIVALLLEIAGLQAGEIAATLPRATRSYLLRILRPAESAARRLIAVAARDLVVEPRPADARGGMPKSPVILRSSPRTRSAKPATPSTMQDGPLAFPVLDPLKDPTRIRRRYARSFPRISILGVTDPRPVPPPPAPGDAVDAKRLCRRLAALQRALDDLPGHAKRFARWQARLKARIGYPPGHRKRRWHEVDDILRECQSLSIEAQDPDTS